MVKVQVDNVWYSFPGGVTAVAGVSFELGSGELLCLLGPSGCGKTTLLRLIGGYLLPDQGCVRVGGRDVTAEPPERRRTGMVFQNGALFPHLSAIENVAFGLRVRGTPKAERLAKANEMLDWVGLTGDERARRPAALSGGQQQRVALARALAFGPELLLLDEPFASLDRALRERLREDLKRLQQKTGVTTVFVTHDREEALALGDRIGVLNRGTLLQAGTPEEVYRFPASAAVAESLGHRNLFRLTGANRTALDAEGVPPLPAPAGPAAPGDTVILWPERLRIRPGKAGGTGALSAIVAQSRIAGSYRVVTARLGSGRELEVHVPDDGASWRPGDPVEIEIPPGAVSVVPRQADAGKQRSGDEIS